MWLGDQLPRFEKCEKGEKGEMVGGTTELNG